MGQGHIKAQLHIYYSSNINHSPSPGVGLHPTTPRHLSEEFRKQVGPFWTLWPNRSISLINLNWSFHFACDRLQRSPSLWAWSTSSFSTHGAHRQGLALFKTQFLWGTTTLAEPCPRTGLLEPAGRDTALATPHRCPAAPTASTSPPTPHTGVTVTMNNLFHSYLRED